ncbi:TetR/AcrR family transcriptional regulator [Nocardioides sp.]|uniref:TetR/AcrR family transcriptional regulator n=1 Tax=Nocardioides sp. TaxID=35761 RepID=UPI0027174E08|nr:WHG domain-containing protein [Nocardioides sp.]MDO9457900.1 WHG domain-containing protein [Nocardioides sp.]
MTQVDDPTLTRRERQREGTVAEIVATARALLAEGVELSLRAVATRMGMTAPALYRYVASYQELVDVVAFEIDRVATEGFQAAADQHAPDDPAARLVAAGTEFRMWALANPREFSLVFANPVAEPMGHHRDLITVQSSCCLMTDLIFEIWQQRRFPVPAVDDLPPDVRASVLEPLIPADVDKIPLEHRGLVWVYMQGWTQLYGVVTLEVMGHMDPRVIESGEMFVDVVRRFAPTLDLADDLPRLEAIVRARLTA